MTTTTVTIIGGEGAQITGTTGGDNYQTTVTGDYPLWYLHNIIHGGLGNDTLTSTVTSALAAVQGYFVGVDFSLYLAHLYGDEGNDILVGDDSRVDYLDGGTGNDTISGNGGDDIITDEDGRNTIDGGAGEDTLTLGGDQKGTKVTNVEHLVLDGFVQIDLALLNSFSSVGVNATQCYLWINQPGTLTARLSDTASYEVHLASGDNDFDMSYSVADLTFNAFFVDGTQTIKTGSGNDTFSNFRSGVDISSGSGDDDIHLFSATGKVDGGDGQDTLIGYGDLTRISVTNVETLSVDEHVTGTAAFFSSFKEIGSEAGAVEMDLSDAGTAKFKVADGVTGTVGGSDGDDGIDLSAATGAWTILGGAGADVIVGGSGGDHVDGGQGSDTFKLGGVQADYLVVDNLDGTWTVTDKRPGAANDDVDTLRNVETLKFSDGSVLSLVKNTAPVVANAIADQSAAEGSEWSFVVPADSFTDPDGDTLAYTATLDGGDPLPSWLSFDAATRTFEGAPPADSDHAISIKVTASDGDLSVSDTFAVTINHLPTDIGLSATTVEENVRAGTVVGTLSAIDPDGDVLSFTLLDNPDGVFAIKNGQLVVAEGADIDFETHQSYDVSLRVSDGGGLHHDETFTITVMDVVDHLTGTRAANTLKGGSGADLIEGLGGGDRLYGNAGDDTIAGGAGVDKLYGGDGADIFVFVTGDSGKTRLTADTIFDFSNADSIDLTGWDANSKVAGMQGFDFVGKHAFSGQAGELHFVKESSDTWIEGDTNGDRKADFVIHLDDAVGLKIGNFLI